MFMERHFIFTFWIVWIRQMIVEENVCFRRISLAVTYFTSRLTWARLFFACRDLIKRAWPLCEMILALCRRWGFLFLNERQILWWHRIRCGKETIFVWGDFDDELCLGVLTRAPQQISFWASTKPLSNESNCEPTIIEISFGFRPQLRQFGAMNWRQWR